MLKHNHIVSVATLGIGERMFKAGRTLESVWIKCKSDWEVSQIEAI